MPDPTPKSENVRWHAGHVSRDDRRGLLRQSGCTVWLTGLPASGKSTIAFAVERMLIDAGQAAYVLDGDNIRHGLCGNLGFSAEDRAENIRRIGEVARLFADAGLVTLTSFVSPYRADRKLVRSLHEEVSIPFVEVFVDTPVEACEARDPKGLYKKARAGAISNFTGVNDPYEPPLAPELVLRTQEYGIQDCSEAVIKLLKMMGLLELR
ncbi:MAG: adenylyl-sulfate kinase [Phycisphaerales bacterium]|nr:adenylyl-sulfate kinase [Phycisphaerales bacterium]MCB9858764.1 adenylyl-sulfate kinase [Phycisphaerales bacterium]